MVNVRCLACQVKYRVLAAKNNNLPECQAPIHAPKFPYRAPSPRKPRSYNRERYLMYNFLGLFLV
ncbi:hypothetical protein E2C01_057994 [Portunus trituberculatus]|uniref:Uncharacterized protein n=1 Tax=Portunus trituberculatus TaxID=210409 RepID=A0A5B7H2K9_PORTR|nr:hypothetical protein [Portunus trituberculatus]